MLRGHRRPADPTDRLHRLSDFRGRRRGALRQRDPAHRRNRRAGEPTAWGGAAARPEPPRTLCHRGAEAGRQVPAAGEQHRGHRRPGRDRRGGRHGLVRLSDDDDAHRLLLLPGGRQAARRVDRERGAPQTGADDRDPPRVRHVSSRLCLV
ncbi:hypothetical protein STIAU_1223 [Stigmatella aurantiaca DW4/3-1]|uniref:Uncharacterized protein n=1 Tax=Stigmatella aurantiaca (strain DW4/3-1) TaxID=378806 RepID=Q08MR0_STIAD|nr:hypothetical protein STIAU_1223 [Stigmatella aurantiaca DW4/3-1]